MFGIVLFFFGSLINALSININMLIAGRAIQGFGGGGVMSMTFIIVTDVAPVHLRPRFQSLLAVVYGIASVAGPLLGKIFITIIMYHVTHFFFLQVVLLWTMLHGIGIFGLMLFLLLFHLLSWSSFYMTPKTMKRLHSSPR